MSVVRLAVVVALVGCGGASTVPLHEPSDSAASEPVPSGEGMRIQCECRTGPVPARVGQRPMVARRVILERDGTLRTFVMYAAPPHDEATRPLAEDAVERLHRAARPLYVKRAGEAYEAPVPDGMSCIVKIAEGPPELTIQSAWPTSHPKLRPLLEQLVALLPPPP